MTRAAGASRDPSQVELGRPSRKASFVDAKLPSYSKPAIAPPGLSSQRSSSRPVTQHLELRLATEDAAVNRETWPTSRDIAILLALDQYRYLDRYQLQALFFEGPRSCQYRLKWLVERGLVRAWRVTIRPGYIQAPSIYLLSAHGARALPDWFDEDPEPFVNRADHALTRRYHLAHDLQANQFFADLAASARGIADQGLYHWVGQHGVRRGYADDEDRGPIPDGWGRFLTSDREVLIHLEWDRGSELARRLRLKITAYMSYFGDRPGASHNQVLFVSPADQREEQIRQVAFSVLPRSRECCQVWTTTIGRLAANGPLGDVWRGSNVGPRGSRFPSCPVVRARRARSRTPSASLAGGNVVPAGQSAHEGAVLADGQRGSDSGPCQSGSGCGD